jgi:Zn ribbon nucleic-acid-binding protein
MYKGTKKMRKEKQKIKYECLDCDYKYLITRSKKDILSNQNQKDNDICPHCKKQMPKSNWNEEDIRASEASDLIMSREL